MSLEIMHIDMDAFFAAVEQLDNPQLKGKPVIVGGVRLNNRGVVSTASYEARKYGVHSAMSIVEAKRLCPQGIYLPCRMKRYVDLSESIFSFLFEYTPLVEKISIDEAFLDLAGCHRLFGSSIKIGKKIRDELKTKFGLNATIGLATNKFLAKLASDLGKPDGFFIIEEDKIDEILDPLPVGEIWGVGSKTEARLKDKGVLTIGMLKKLSYNELISILGKMGAQLYYQIRGIDYSSVKSCSEVKSISNEETFMYNLTDRENILTILMEMSIKVCRRMRQNGYRGDTVFIKVRYGDFTTITRQIRVKTNINIPDELYQVGKRLLINNLLNKPIRLLGVGISNLTKNKSAQLSLFSDKVKGDKLTTIIDEIKDRFGDRSIIRARSLKNPIDN